uniref:Uncharacterized protein n=1 Tax=Mus spicilegus TaxID=10103 RepID=A0A8C6IL78_MUSSI
MVELRLNLDLLDFCGSQLNFRRAVFSVDSKYVFCVSGDSVRVYSTGAEESEHILRGHKHLVSGILTNPSNHLQRPCHTLTTSQLSVPIMQKTMKNPYWSQLAEMATSKCGY